MYLVKVKVNGEDKVLKVSNDVLEWMKRAKSNTEIIWVEEIGDGNVVGGTKKMERVMEA